MKTVGFVVVAPEVVLPGFDRAAMLDAAHGLASQIRGNRDHQIGLTPSPFGDELPAHKNLRAGAMPLFEKIIAEFPGEGLALPSHFIIRHTDGSPATAAQAHPDGGYLSLTLGLEGDGSWLYYFDAAAVHEWRVPPGELALFTNFLREAVVGDPAVPHSAPFGPQRRRTALLAAFGRTHLEDAATSLTPAATHAYEVVKARVRRVDDWRMSQGYFLSSQPLGR
jgi:hypothetical protein